MGAHMIQLQNILCPTDFSDLSAHALSFARSFAETYRAKLHLLHVVDEAYQYWTVMGTNGVPLGPPPDEMLAAARTGMSKFVATHFAAAALATGAAAPPDVVTEVRLGRPFLEIIRHAREISADLIVLGTHGRSGLSHVLLGSVTEKVVRKSPCPVLTVRHPDHGFTMP